MNTIVDQIRDYGYYIRDPRMDGFTQFGAKQKLYKILWETQKQLEDSPEFLGEKEWVDSNICAMQHK
jgi:hypothetical protein